MDEDDLLGGGGLLVVVSGVEGLWLWEGDHMSTLVEPSCGSERVGAKRCRDGE